MALYIPAGARRRRLIVVGVVALVGGLLLGYVVGRATSPGLEDEVTEVQDLARDASDALRRIPIEYEQAVAGEGGETVFTINEAIDRAKQQLDDAYAEAIWLSDTVTGATDQGFVDLHVLVEERAGSDEFEAAVEALVEQVAATFGIQP